MQRDTGAASLRALLQSAALKPNKALGQNFLIDEAAVNAILEAASLEGMAALEIGPGLGALTAGMLERAAASAAVEIDGALCAQLRARFGSALLLYHADFLKCDLEEIHRRLGGGPFCVLGNLPYYITTPICMRLLSSPLPIRRMVLMMQKEAAAHFLSAPSSRAYGPAAVLSRLYYETRTILSLSPQSYYPQPEVDSCVLLFTRNGRPFEPALAPLLQACFRMRRKTLFNNLKAFCPDTERIEAALAACALSPQARAESLEAESFLSLARALL